MKKFIKKLTHLSLGKIALMFLIFYIILSVTVPHLSLVTTVFWFLVLIGAVSIFVPLGIQLSFWTYHFLVHGSPFWEEGMHQEYLDRRKKYRGGP